MIKIVFSQAFVA